MRHIFRPLDRYVFAEFVKIFAVTALGFPILLIVIDLTDHVQVYLERHIPTRDIALSYLFWIPDSMFMVLPAAVLFATVFSIGTLTRHTEVTAAKASGISFYRLVMPIFFGAMLAFGLDLGLGKIVPMTNQRRSELLQEDKAQVGTSRFNFAFAGEYGRVYKAFELRTDSGQMRQLQIERKGKGADYPTYLLTADTAKFDAKTGRWTLRNGEMNIISDSGPNLTIQFAYARDNQLTERPAEMMSKPPDPHDMTYAALTRAIGALERSGGDANLLRVERALKIAIPATCLIIALFGAPLATSTQRGGSAYGIAVSLATTMIFLLMIQLTRAIGGKGVIAPDYAAWIPGVLFGFMGLVLLARVRT
ncbi:MAG TPA: LptF/LptG family permease [Gemmatimonadaceae bacterium]|nr:LptF/LptG family permease [Gemmatimonadaceae bacterium]